MIFWYCIYIVYMVMQKKWRYSVSFIFFIFLNIIILKWYNIIDILFFQNIFNIVWLNRKKYYF